MTWKIFKILEGGMAIDLYFILVLLWLSEEGDGNPLQYSCLENPMDRGTCWAAVHKITQSQTWLKRLSMHECMHALEKEMVTHSSILAWRIPGMEEPGGLLSMGSHRVRHDWSDLAATALCLSTSNFPDYACMLIYSHEHAFVSGIGNPSKGI